MSGMPKWLWLQEELDRRAAGNGWDSVDTGSDSDSSRRTGTTTPMVPPAKPWQAPKRWSQ